MSAAQSGSDSGARNVEDGWMDRFMKHCEQMRCFLQYHVAWRVFWDSPIDRMLPYDIRHALAETGGKAAVIDETDWALLLPLRRVTARHIVPN
jgi:hypothetical protein